MSLIGKSPQRPDAFDKVTGGKAFPVNVKVPGMLHAKLLRSPYPHARILGIDTSAAEKLPGVKAVLVPSEVPKRKFTPVYFVPSDAGSMVQDMLIMSDTVRFAGQPVAAVAATSLRIAEQAIELI
ncbi:MAG: carbon monoxide dehydrogenase, partial [Gammaproteobacteria bacterium]|nr:carbon monoxide dehydrogenase [Gammaproteobacteria bacterium]